MNSDVLVVIGLGTARLSADVARVGPRPRVDSQVLLEIVGSMEGLVAHVAGVLLVFLVLLDVSQAVVLPDELSPAVVAGVGPDVPVGVHVGRVVTVPVKSGATLIALEGLGAAGGVGPLVQLKVPLGAECLGADLALVGPLAIVDAHVYRQGGAKVDALADGTLDVLVFALGVRHEATIVGTTHVAGETGHVDEALVAVGAGLGLLVVGLLVPGELLLRVEDFATVTDVVLQLLFDVQVVTVLVLGEIRVSARKGIFEILKNWLENRKKQSIYENQVEFIFLIFKLQIFFDFSQMGNFKSFKKLVQN